MQSLVSVGNRNCICMIVSKREKTGKRTYSLLRVEFGDKAFRWWTVFEWYRYFKGGHCLLWVGDQCCGCPFMLKNQYIHCCFAFGSVVNSRRSSIMHVCMIVFPNFDWKFGHEACVCGTHFFFGGGLLVVEQKKEKWMNICICVLQQAEMDKNFIQLIIVRDDMWCVGTMSGWSSGLHFTNQNLLQTIKSVSEKTECEGYEEWCSMSLFPEAEQLIRNTWPFYSVC